MTHAFCERVSLTPPSFLGARSSAVCSRNRRLMSDATAPDVGWGACESESFASGCRRRCTMLAASTLTTCMSKRMCCQDKHTIRRVSDDTEQHDPEHQRSFTHNHKGTQSQNLIQHNPHPIPSCSVWDTEHQVDKIPSFHPMQPSPQSPHSPPPLLPARHRSRRNGHAHRAQKRCEWKTISCSTRWLVGETLRAIPYSKPRHRAG